MKKVLLLQGTRRGSCLINTESVLREFDFPIFLSTFFLHISLKYLQLIEHVSLTSNEILVQEQQIMELSIINYL